MLETRRLREAGAVHTKRATARRFDFARRVLVGAGFVLLAGGSVSIAQDARIGGAVEVKATALSQRDPTVSASSEGYQVFWVEDFAIEGRRFSEGGTALGGAFAVSDVSGARYPSSSPGVYGDVLVAWEQPAPTPENSYDIFARLYGADGESLGPPWRLNTTQVGIQEQVAVGRCDQGFVAVWMDSEADGSDSGIVVQRLAVDGTPVGEERVANAFTAGFQAFPAVAVASDCAFAVAWESWGLDGSGSAVVLRLFGASGEPLTSEVTVNSNTPGNQQRAAVVATSSGEYVVLWEDHGSHSGTDIKARRLSSTGSFLSSEVVVNTALSGSQRNVRAVVSVDETIVTIWESFSAGGAYDVKARRLDPMLFGYGDEFRVNSHTFAHQYFAAVASHADGDFFAVWEDADTLHQGVYAQPFTTSAVGDRVWHDLDRDGLQDSEEPSVAGVTVHLDRRLVGIVASTVTDDRGEYRFSAVPPDDYSVVFEPTSDWVFTIADAGIGPLDSFDSDADATGRTALFAVASGAKTLRWDAGLVALPLFADGFESGDSTAWSAAIP